MGLKTSYVAKQPDDNGLVHYHQEENDIWRDLYRRQMSIIQGRACSEYIRGLEILDMPQDRIPQLEDLNQPLRKATGWQVAPVPALIPFDQFFDLLAHRKFPAATFIRTREDFDYITEPDIFHEFFGHCPMLTEPVYADFMQKYGELGKVAKPEQQTLLARLYWFTVEFGLINTPEGLRIYGGGILSSPEETVYALESDGAERKPFNTLEALRTPYRIDIKQPIYFIINDYQALYDLMEQGLLEIIDEAIALGEYPPKFPPIDQKPPIC